MSTSDEHRDQDHVAKDGNSIQPPPLVSPVQASKTPLAPRYAIAQSAPEEENRGTQRTGTQRTSVIDPLSDEPVPEVAPSLNRPWQFSISFLQVIFLIVAIASAMLGLVIKANLKDTHFFYYVLLLVIAPMGMMILLGMVKGGYVLWKQWREERRAIREMMDRGTPNQQPLHNDEDKI